VLVGVVAIVISVVVFTFLMVANDEDTPRMVPEETEVTQVPEETTGLTAEEGAYIHEALPHVLNLQRIMDDLSQVNEDPNAVVMAHANAVELQFIRDSLLAMSPPDSLVAYHTALTMAVTEFGKGCDKLCDYMDSFDGDSWDEKYLSSANAHMERGHEWMDEVSRLLNEVDK